MRGTNQKGIGGREDTQKRGVLPSKRHEDRSSVVVLLDRCAHEVRPMVILENGRTECSGFVSDARRAPGETFHERPEKQFRRYEARRRVAGQAQESHPLMATCHQGFSRSHGDLPEIQFDTALPQDRRNKIMITDRSSADGHENVDSLGSGILENLSQGRSIVGDDAIGDGVATRRVHDGRDTETV